jgi:tRNA-2-methylthio-N6-dimethylallyladenosine synthase
MLRGLGRVETAWASTEEYLFPSAEPGRARGRATAFVTAMKGCDNVCSFCIVPHTRGREVSRPAAEIVSEVASLAAVGLREVTLVGQNVNSYAGGCTFAALLRRVAEVPGLARIRFTTSHPMDLSDELVDCFAPAGQGGIRQLMPHFHLPVQHGSDAVLRRMRRTGTVAEYEARVARLLAVAPGLALTSDIICGFPGETDEEHASTLALLGRVPFDALFSFVYSRRPHTSADAALERNERALQPSPEWAEVPRDVAHSRLDEVQALQKERTLARRRAFVGREVEVLVENLNPPEAGGGEGAGGGAGGSDFAASSGERERASRRYGRSQENCGVHFSGDARVGDVVRVRVERASLLSLAGTQVGMVAPTNVARHRLAVLHS